MRVLVLGATGLLGSAMMRGLPDSDDLEVVGTIRSEKSGSLFEAGDLATKLVVLRDVQDYDRVGQLFDEIRPDAVINCISPSRASLVEGDPIQIIPICALLPHQLARLCEEFRARLIHFSTDGVFSGSKGGYTEEDRPDATDVYGISKWLGEPRGPHAITIRTSMIGHEQRGSQGLLEWFLSQEKRCKCYSRAVFSGLPAVVLARIVRDVVLPHPEHSGLYHVAAQPITKCELLRLIADVYGKSIEILPDDTIVIDRSLNAERFRRATGYVAPDWRTLIQAMHSSR
jgi:dTDP-4-dehydrorhamnose reductase